MWATEQQTANPTKPTKWSQWHYAGHVGDTVQFGNLLESPRRHYPRGASWTRTIRRPRSTGSRMLQSAGIRPITIHGRDEFGRIWNLAEAETTANTWNFHCYWRTRGIHPLILIRSEARRVQNVQPVSIIIYPATLFGSHASTEQFCSIWYRLRGNKLRSGFKSASVQMRYLMHMDIL